MPPEAKHLASEEGQPGTATLSPQIIRDGRMHVRTEDLDEARTFVGQVLEKYHARVSGDELENTNYQTTWSLRVRVEAVKLDSLFRDLEMINGVIIAKSMQARDVTEEFIDLETRLENKRSYLQQYRELLKTARTTEDVLKISEQIRQIEEELESVEGRLHYLSDQVAMSTLELYIFQEKAFVYRSGRRLDFIEKLKESVADGWYGFVSFVLLLFRLWPFVLLLVLGIWVFRKVVRQKSASNRQP